MNYEVIVVGGGHAGCEAALATARMGHKTLLVTGNINNIADMPCNPSIGGSAKGIVVREIDALGGEMGRCADKSLLQIKMLNSAKGPAVRSLRAQADKITYPKNMLKTLRECDNLEILEALVKDVKTNDNKVSGVLLEDGREIYSKAVILTTGTYMNADILVGDTRRREGPHGEKPSNYLSDNLAKKGFKLKRLKTGTPPRIKRDSIDFSKTKLENGDSVYHTFSFDNKVYYDVDNQVPCYLTYTTEETHKIILDNLNKSSMYGGLPDIKGIGPRYCPSIEDKVVRFRDKERHQLFLEPESLYYDDIYLQGFSTSMPHDIQEKMVHSLPGLERAEILKYAYAIEYDAIYPTQLKFSLETKLIENLFTAGQINGTSGYEEAACQGLMAGINAGLKLEGKDPLILKRDEAYIGVLIDDLITKGIRDPYRLLTSRAEYRLLLRTDNADLRLRDYGYKVGLVSKERYDKFLEKKANIEKAISEFKGIRLTPKDNDYLESLGTTLLKDGVSLYDLLKRPEIKVNDLLRYLNNEYDEDVLYQVMVKAKYEGYINKELEEAARMKRYEDKKIPKDVDYDSMHNLASEAKQKLKEVEPETIGQAMRISGVNPADISILTMYLKRGK
ncbi:MAG TPA: tRNA uridine-5-carboxymethylaminomethyl(34) synthesis enzyme MnmG [Candidatus Coprosoma intestinipullorum]|uniref:tRNA uridine 5-carboxymethylaminomethyl modification enzyme MnmG n=1 Tax=Candidatus Coprosoma intestinipullorum TaxID=2840752 RepID=A0A9D0ZQ81_9FIRM|nr:tRNA uridine-5-carboxymethylaminomethyl(34) synthesis enzyme MnmG [Candidatus Coprosoma intestinipullorum]